ncbi:MAG TPA: nitronate monooxygenase [Baekduia sp.]
MLETLAVPIVQAPMAGGPSTPELAVAVADAGGLGFLAAALKTPEGVAADVAAVRAGAPGAPFGVNVFVPSGTPAAPEVVAAYAERLAGEAERAGVALGTPVHDDDLFAAKVALLVDDPVPVVSFTFGCPDDDVLGALRDAGSRIWITVTDPDEAERAARAGADALIVQGVEAGGHRGAWADRPDAVDYGVLALLQLVRDRVGGDVPLVAAGGIATAAGVEAVLVAGAAAAQVGTAFMLCPEAGTPPAHRAAIADPTSVTGLTRAFSGRLARGIVNRIQRDHSAEAPIAYPEVVKLLGPLRARGLATGDADLTNLWAGEAHALARALPAAEVVALLTPAGRPGRP